MKALNLFFTLIIPFYLAGCLAQQSPKRYSFQKSPEKEHKARAEAEKPSYSYYIAAQNSNQQDSTFDELGESEDVKTVAIPGTNQVKKTITKHPGYHLASTDPFAEDQTTESMIEEKLFKRVQDAYERRDQDKFIELYDFFFESFPNTLRKPELLAFHNQFFYSESRAVKHLDNALVELTFLKAKSLKELTTYFRELKKNKIHAIQVDVLNLIDTPVYLFGETPKGLGYYFPTHNGMTINNVLEKIVSAAHESNIQLFASFPLRHHPWLGNNEVYIMDESWNALENKTTPNSKLDLLNPNSHFLLKRLIDSLLAINIDGIIFKDDFTYDLYEGFSETAIKRYQKATGREVSLSDMFIPIDSDSGEGYHVVTTPDFDTLSNWRAGEISQLLWDLYSQVKRIKPQVKVGIEVTPEMFLDAELAIKWYSTNLHHLQNQKMDFFILKWRKYNSEAETDPQSYRAAMAMLRDHIENKRKIYGKIPLSQETQNVIRLNDRIREQITIKESLDGIETAIGPVDRLKNQDFLSVKSLPN